ncbi:hypothetical protein [Sphingosinicella sp. BN140058]|uniref:hypothetical protein n=1 Tax=Sphingosinicella sp. BN140058 TaxID=1892855 RepID=UPI0010133D55|nr:hypothetical protein [Sphingosinicella sp. BN140058]QAY75566.1 hypothetical protein ETR14_02755 [Sphingosinicella sp. BN140058]
MNGGAQIKSAKAPALAPSRPAAPGSQTPEPLPSHRRAFAEALTRHGGKMRDQALDMIGDAGAVASPRPFAAIASADAPIAAGDVDPALHAQFERIAAAIAEVAKSGVEPEVHLSLPLGAYRVEGAVLGRDLAGQINVALIPGSVVPPAVAAQWSEQLSERLVRRQLRIGRISVQPSNRRAFSPA